MALKRSVGKLVIIWTLSLTKLSDFYLMAIYRDHTLCRHFTLRQSKLIICLIPSRNSLPRCSSGGHMPASN